MLPVFSSLRPRIYQQPLRLATKDYSDKLLAGDERLITHGLSKTNASLPQRCDSVEGCGIFLPGDQAGG